MPTQPRASRPRAERRFALQALERLGLPGASLRLLTFSEAAHYRVDAATGRFALRPHPPGRMPEAVLRSELAWLVALSREAALWVPEPVPAPDGETVVVCGSPGGARSRRSSAGLPGRRRGRRGWPPGRCDGRADVRAVNEL